MQFSIHLIERAQAYFLSKHGKEMTADEAVTFLLSLSTVYLAFAKVEAKRRLRSAGIPQGTPTAALGIEA